MLHNGPTFYFVLKIVVCICIRFFLKVHPFSFETCELLTLVVILTLASLETETTLKVKLRMPQKDATLSL